MNHIYHVYTPFYRMGNLLRMMEMIGPLGVEWHPIFDDSWEFHQVWTDEWPHIHPLYCPVGLAKPGEHLGHFKGNWFLEHETIHPDHRYCELNDDDFYEPDFFEKIDRHPGDAIVCTLQRGHCQPEQGPQYGITPLTASPDNLKPGLISSQQLIVKGSCIGAARYAYVDCGDFMFIEQILSRVTPEFAPEACVWFNYLEPGRWNTGSTGEKQIIVVGSRHEISRCRRRRSNRL